MMVVMWDEIVRGTLVLTKSLESIATNKKSIWNI